MATMYEFAGSVSSSNCIYWSKDHILAFCTDASIKVLTLESSVRNTESGLVFSQSAIAANPNVLDIPGYTCLEYQKLIDDIPKHVEMQLITDKIMNPFKFTQNTAPALGFTAAAWSPVGVSTAGSCILATLTRDYRLQLHTQRKSKFKWFEVIDLSERRLKASRPAETYRTLAKFQEYRDWCYTQAYTALTWSPVLHKDLETGTEFAVLVAGTKNGEIVLWKTQVPTDTEPNCCLYRSFSIHHCHITHMCWSEQTGNLAVGYLDGQVHMVKVSLSDPATPPTSRCLHGDADLMRVASMCFVPDKQGCEVLLVNKEDCVLGFHLDQQQNLLSDAHVFGDSTLHGTGLCWAGGGSVLLLSMDGVLQKIQVSTNPGDLQLTIEGLTLQLPVTFDRAAIVPGMCVSANSAFLAILQRPTSGYDHLTPIYKAPIKIHLAPVSKIMADSESDTISWTLQRLRDEKGSLRELLDVVDLFRQTILSDQDSTTVELGIGPGLRDLMLHRYMLLVQLSQLEHMLEIEKKETTYSETVAKVKTGLEDATIQILALHIQAVVNRMKACNYTANGDRSKRIFKTMISFLDTNHSHVQHIDLADTIQHLTKLTCQSDVAVETECVICSCQLTQSKLHMKCSNGHSFDLCSQTLQPCGGIDYCKCSVCGALSLSPDQLKEFDWLGDNVSACVLCEGLMVM